VFAALCGCAGMWLLLARVWLCDDLNKREKERLLMVSATFCLGFDFRASLTMDMRERKTNHLPD